MIYRIRQRHRTTVFTTISGLFLVSCTFLYVLSLFRVQIRRQSSARKEEDCVCSLVRKSSVHNVEVEEIRKLKQALLAIIPKNSPIKTYLTKDEVLIADKILLQSEIQDYMAHENRSFITPTKCAIFTTWRSGSTFLGQLIASHPAMFYFYEPLLLFGDVQVRSGDMEKDALGIVKDLFQCNYTNLGKYISSSKTYIDIHRYNSRIWKFCKHNRELCWDPDFLSRSCNQHPFRVMKSVRMRLILAEPLISDMKIIYLIRDPRGTMHSRLKREWCKSEDCISPAKLCQDLVDDYRAALYLRARYKDQIMILRYEDLSVNPYSGSKKVMEFLGLSYTHPMITEYIETHTRGSRGGAWSTYRDSKKTPFAWIEYYTRDDKRKKLDEIQDSCSEALRLWGYWALESGRKPYRFDPLLLPPWPDMVVDDDPVDKENPSTLRI